MTRLLLLLSVWLLAVAATPFDPFAKARIDEHSGAQIPLSGAFTDQQGGKVTLAELGGGKPIFLVPVLHACPNLCGVTLDGLADAMKASHVAAGRDAAIIAFGIDPNESSRDARVSLNALAQRYPELAVHVHATVGSKAAVRQVTDALGYHYAFDPRIGQYAHAAAVAVLTPDGRFSRWLFGLNPDPADLTAALAKARAGETGGLGRRLLLLCYHYDPETGRYSMAISWLLRVGCLITALAVLLYIFLSRRREGRAS